MDKQLDNFDLFCSLLKERLKHPLPGQVAHLKMASRLRLKELELEYEKENAVRSAVLILFYEDSNTIKIPLILRPDYNGVHSGQVAFPGGRWEEDDQNIIYTALREAQEEVNIDPSDVEVIGTLSDLYIPPSNYLVTPVVAYSKNKPNFKKDPAEVDQIIQTEIGFLFDPRLQKEKLINVRGYEIEAPYFDVQNHVVWGATAMMLSELKSSIESIDLINLQR